MGSSQSQTPAATVITDTQTGITNNLRKARQLKQQVQIQRGGLIRRSKQFQQKIRRISRGRK
jgi:hypothetical protein